MGTPDASEHRRDMPVLSIEGQARWAKVHTSAESRRSIVVTVRAFPPRPEDPDAIAAR